MAGVGFQAVTAAITTGTSLITLLQVIAAANQRLLIDEWSISFNGTSNTATPIPVVLAVQTDAGTMSSLTPGKRNASDDETLQVTAQHTATVEPTTTTSIDSLEVHPQTGYTWQAPFGKEINVKGGGRLGLRCTAAASVSAIATMKGTE